MLLVVYPWTCSSFDNLSTVITGNTKVAEHSRAVIGGLEVAVKNMDNIKNAYTKLRTKLSEKLSVDADNFRVCCYLYLYTQIDEWIQIP